MATLLVGVVIVAIVALAIYIVIKDHRSGKCCASCGGCSRATCNGSSCHMSSKEDEEKE